MRALALGLCLLVASSAFADELIRFRTPDGTLGLVDDEDKLPPGAIVESRKPLAAVRGDAAIPAPAAPPAAPAPDPLSGAARSPDEHCAHFGLAPGCLVQHVDAATDWCERGAAERRKHAALERGGSCTRSAYSTAERKLAKSEAAAEALREECLEDGCRVEWLKQDCALPAVAPQ